MISSQYLTHKGCTHFVQTANVWPISNVYVHCGPIKEELNPGLQHSTQAYDDYTVYLGPLYKSHHHIHTLVSVSAYISLRINTDDKKGLNTNFKGQDYSKLEYVPEEIPSKLSVTFFLQYS